MSEQHTVSDSKSSEWHFHPELPIGNNPLFEFPWSLSKIIAYHRDYWLTLSEVSFFLLLSIAGWLLHQSSLSIVASLSFDWAIQVYVRNLVIVLVVAGGLQATGHHQHYN